MNYMTSFLLFHKQGASPKKILFLAKYAFKEDYTEGNNRKMLR